MPEPTHNRVAGAVRDEAAALARIPLDERPGADDGQPDWQPRAGEMHPVDRAFYKLTVKERDLERVRCDRLSAELKEARGYVAATLQMLAPHEVTCRCDRGDEFEWTGHDERCPRRQVGAMLAGMAAQ